MLFVDSLEENILPEHKHSFCVQSPLVYLLDSLNPLKREVFEPSQGKSWYGLVICALPLSLFKLVISFNRRLFLFCLFFSILSSLIFAVYSATIPIRFYRSSLTQMLNNNTNIPYCYPPWLTKNVLVSPRSFFFRVLWHSR